MTASQPQKAHGDRELVIPVDTKTFGEFLTALLGQRRSIEQSFEDRIFFIDQNWLLNLDDIIDQRIASQNSGHLVSFSALIYFEDGRVVRLTSREAFRSYNDISSRMTVGIDLSWTYLIKFPNANIPEKQEIRFRAFTDKRLVDAKIPTPTSKSFWKRDARNELLFYSVSFSDLTWGEDLSSHISSFILSKTRRMGFLSRAIRSIDFRSVFPLGFSIGMVAMMFIAESNSSTRAILTKYPSFNSVAASTPQEKLDFLVDAAAASLTRSDALYGPMLKLMLFFLVATAMWWALNTTKPSFISLNENSASLYKRKSHQFEILKYGVILAGIVSIVAGIFSNTIFEYFKTVKFF